MPGNKLLAIAFIALDLALAYACGTYITRHREHTHFEALERARFEQQQLAETAPLPPSQVLAGCMYMASQTYRVPTSALVGIMHVEGGRIGQAVGNHNGTYDLGPMQVNSLWVPRLARLWNVDYKTAYTALRDNGCENVYISAWILKQKMVQTGGLYNGIAYYHSATPRYGTPYANKVVDTMNRQTARP